MKETKTKPGTKFFAERDSGLINAAVIFMTLSAVFRLAGCWSLWADRRFALLQIALPVFCSLLYMVCLLLFARRALWTTAVPVILSTVFFIARALGFESWVYTLAAVCACISVAVLYTATVFGYVRSKWFILALVALVFLVKLFVADVAALKNAAVPVSFAAGLQEISVLCALLTLFFTALAMKNRRNIEDMGLPKMKAPKVIIKSKTQAEAAEAAGADPAAPESAANSTAAAEEKEPAAE